MSYDLDPEYLKFTERFARALATQDFAAAHGMLAPWLRAEYTPEKLRKMVEEQLQLMADEWDLEKFTYPKGCDVGWNPLTFEQLVDSGKKQAEFGTPRIFPSELMSSNFRKWIKITFVPDHEAEEYDFDYWMVLWYALCEVDGEIKVGYFEFAD